MSAGAAKVSDDRVVLLDEVDDFHREVGERAAERADPAAGDFRKLAHGDLIENLGTAPIDSLIHEPAHEPLVVAHVSTLTAVDRLTKREVPQGPRVVQAAAHLRIATPPAVNGDRASGEQDLGSRGVAPNEPTPPNE